MEGSLAEAGLKALLYQVRFLMQQIGAVAKFHQAGWCEVGQTLRQPVHKVIHEGKKTVPTDMFFEPLPKLFNRIQLRRIRRQRFKTNIFRYF